MRAFVKSVLMGALAPAAPFLFMTTYFAFSGLAARDGRWLDAAWIMLLPLTIALPVVLAASLLLGLPLTWLLRRFRRESRDAYILFGALAGLLVPILFLLAIHAPSGHWLGLLGALGGSVAARTWWRDAREPALLAEGAID